MGCLFSSCPCTSATENNDHGLVPQAEKPKAYTWDQRPKIDPKDYTLDGVKKDTVIVRKPGTINGMPFVIQNCDGAVIFLLDHASQITVDDCKNCTIVTGPIKGSIFVRDCASSRFMVACQQFRVRDCQRLDVFLSCVALPIIEASTGIQFGCYQLYYPQLEEHFEKTGISIYNNNWSTIHDFTPSPDEDAHLKLFPTGGNIHEIFPVIPNEDVDVILGIEKSVVPYTCGRQQRPCDESSLVVLFNDGLSHVRAYNFVKEMKANNPGCVLVQTREITMTVPDAQRVFLCDHYNMAVRQGPVIAFEYCGANCISQCQQTLVQVSQGSTGLVFASSNPKAANNQLENFFNFADMQMNG